MSETTSIYDMMIAARRRLKGPKAGGTIAAIARQNNKIARVFCSARQVETDCRYEWTGPMSRGVAMVIDGSYRRAAQRCAYEIEYGLTRKTYTVVADCGNPRCLNHRHLRLERPTA